LDLEIDFNRQVYDFDTRIHLLIKGPGIAPGSSFDFLASNVDLAPTMLSLADIPRPPGAMRQTKQEQPLFFTIWCATLVSTPTID
jgi:arylsulfatase A-like enzyme